MAGPLLAAGLVAWLGVRLTLFLAAIPGLFAALAIMVAAREARHRAEVAGAPIRRRLRLTALRDAGVFRALTPVAFFEFGNLASTLLILRASQLLTTPYRPATVATSMAILIYAAHNAIAAITALVAGRWYDHAGPRVVFAAGAAASVIAYVILAVGSSSIGMLLVAFGAGGAGIGFVAPTQSAVVARLLPDDLRGSGFGVLGVVQAAGDVVATVVAGVLYTVVAPVAAFGYAAAWLLGAIAASGMLANASD